MKAITFCSFDKEFLQEYSREHIWYEVSMFFETGSRLRTTNSDQVIRNATIESFLIHLRNLLDFFYPEGQVKPDDVIADYYFASGNTPTNFPAKSKTLDDAEIRAHKQLSHLTSKRYTGNDPKKNWNFNALMREMAGVLTIFVSQPSNDKLAPEFVSNVRDLLGKLNRAFYSNC